MRWYKDSKTKNKLETLLFAFVCLFFSIICFFRATESLLLLTDSDSVIVEYQGSFQVREIAFLRNTIYLFTLNNNDKVSVPAEIISKENFLNFNQKSMFKYSKYADFRGWHNCLSIVSLDGIELLKEKEVRYGYGGSIFLYYFISLMFLICSLFFVALEYADTIYKSIKRQQRKKKKGKQDNKKQTNKKNK
ncbi:MAG: hypothetical protein IJ349_06865 [Clostridia bacterium]|nr:hypothetical protein [Clostridia bacterium]